MPRILPILALLCCTATVVRAQTVEPERAAQTFMIRALTEAQNGDIDEAVELLGRGIRLAPSAAALYDQLAHLQRRQGETGRAQLNSRQAVSLAPARLPYCLRLVSITAAIESASRVESASRARDHFDQLAPADTLAPTELIAAADTARAIGHVSGAIRWYDAALERGADTTLVYRPLAEVLPSGDRLAAVVAWLRPQPAVADENGPTLRAVRELIATDPAGALEQLEATATSLPSDSASAIARVRLRATAALGDGEAVATAASDLVDRFPRDDAHWQLAADALLEAGLAADALEVASRGRLIFSGSYPLYLAEARALAALDRAQEATDLLTRGFRLATEDNAPAEMRRQLLELEAELLERSGDADAARERRDLARSL